jgi:hypothetical protein
MPEKILNCSSVCQAYTSLGAIVGIPEQDLRRFVQAATLTRSMQRATEVSGQDICSWKLSLKRLTRP